MVVARRLADGIAAGAKWGCVRAGFPTVFIMLERASNAPIGHCRWRWPWRAAHIMFCSTRRGVFEPTPLTGGGPCRTAHFAQNEKRMPCWRQMRCNSSCKKNFAARLRSPPSALMGSITIGPATFPTGSKMLRFEKMLARSSVSRIFLPRHSLSRGFRATHRSR